METMHRTREWLMFAGLAVGTAVGCGSSQAITRGQSPAGPPPAEHHVAYGDAPHGAVYPGESHPGDVEYGGCPVGDECYGEGGYGEGGYGGVGYGGGGAYGWGRNQGWEEPSPAYSIRRNYVYPPANVPPSFVQYPYYTHKGPSDFFMQ
jgi:hypothetical protein